ncbi:MAG: glycosyltransferase family 2 protein [Terracidiphilus sp.]
MRKTLSVAMIAMNEEANLPRTLESVRWADEIVLVDSGSTDRTIEIAQSFGAKTSYHAFGGHGEQKNIALDLCTSDWILLLDADEVLTPELQNEILKVLACQDGCEPEFEAYWIPRLNLYFGRWIRHGGFYPDRKLRLFRRGAARLSEGVGPHSTPQFAGPKGKLKGDMLHYAYPTLAIYLEHMNRYSAEIGALLAAKGRTSRSLAAFLWNAVANPAATFIYNYFFRLGFMDGREGLILHVNHSVYIHWKFIKAWRIGMGKE